MVGGKGGTREKQFFSGWEGVGTWGGSGSRGRGGWGGAGGWKGIARSGRFGRRLRVVDRSVLDLLV